MLMPKIGGFASASRFVTNYAPQEMIDKISSLGIPAVAISLRHDDEGREINLTQSWQMKNRLT